MLYYVGIIIVFQGLLKFNAFTESVQQPCSAYWRHKANQFQRRLKLTKF